MRDSWPRGQSSGPVSLFPLICRCTSFPCSRSHFSKFIKCDWYENQDFLRSTMAMRGEKSLVCAVAMSSIPTAFVLASHRCGACWGSDPWDSNHGFISRRSTVLRTSWSWPGKRGFNVVEMPTADHSSPPITFSQPILAGGSASVTPQECRVRSNRWSRHNAADGKQIFIPDVRSTTLTH